MNDILEQKTNSFMNNNNSEINTKIKVKDEEIMKKLEPYICKVYKGKNINDFESGFLCKIPYPYRTKSIHVLITSNNVIKTKLFIISFREEKNKTFIYYYPERKIYKSLKYNIQLIEIFPEKDNLHNFLELDDNIFNNEDFYIKNKDLPIVIPYFSESNQLSMYLGTINKYNKNESENIFREVNLVNPIILLDTFKVIGINKDMKENKFTLLKNPLLEFIKNEIIIKKEIDYNNVNKDINIFNNSYSYNDNEGIEQIYKLYVYK